MNNLAKYGIFGVLIAALIGAWYYFRNQETDEEKTDELGLATRSPTPPPPSKGSQKDGPVTPVLYSTETGAGKEAIEARIKQIHGTDRGQNLIASAGQDPYTGLAWKTDFKNAMARIFGGSYDIPVIPSIVNARYKQFLQGIVEQGKTINELDREGDFSRALQVWRNALDFGDFSFWPPDIADQIEQGAFKASGPADKNRSERYHVFAEDARKFASNLITLQRQYDDALRKEAIRDLRAQGWKFQGLDTPK